MDVGGFLGIGEKPVALDMASVRLTRTEGEDLRAYLSVSEDELEQMESWSGEEG